MVKLLVEEIKAKLDVPDQSNATPLFVAVSCREGNIALYLASKGANLEAETRDQETPLSIAGTLSPALVQARESGSMHVLDSEGGHDAMETDEK